MTIGDRIRRQRENLGLTQTELAEKVSISKQTLYKYEMNIITNIPSDKLEHIGKILDVSPSYLMGWKEIEEKKGITINVLGRVAAGIPLEAVEEIIDTEEISEELAHTGEFFGLQIHGDSMEPRICDGDVVIVRRQEDAETGDIVIALVNGDDATCKRLKKYHDGVELIANNPTYSPLFYTNEEIINKPVRIIGKVVELRAKL